MKTKDQLVSEISEAIGNHPIDVTGIISVKKRTNTRFTSFVATRIRAERGVLKYMFGESVSWNVTNLTCAELWGILDHLKNREVTERPKNTKKPSGLEYEIGTMELDGEIGERAFLMFDGFAVEIESEDNPVPAVNPVTMTYPRKADVDGSPRLRMSIEEYTGHGWDGDVYSIALRYGKVKGLTKKKRESNN